ncbi:MAG: glycosyltransferase [Bacteroidota bacterium]
MRISAVIITLNEADHIGRCLQSLQGVADEFIVVDAFSQDETVALAEKAGAKVLQHAFDGFGAQKNRGIAAASGEYILSLDADEALSEELTQAILSLKQSVPTATAWEMRRRNFVGKKWIRYGGWYPDWKLRLWRKDVAQWNLSPVHESLEFVETVVAEKLSGDLLHYSFRSVADHLHRIRRYTRIRAAKSLKQGKNLSLLKAIFKGWYRFCRLYILKAGCLDGKIGLTLSWNAGLRDLIQYALMRRMQFPADRKRICFVNTTKAWGGGEKWHTDSARFLAESGEQIFFLYGPNRTLQQSIETSEMEAHQISLSNLSFLNPFKLRQLVRFFRRQKTHTVLLNGSNDLKSAGLAAFLAGVPRIIYRRGLAKAPKNSWLNAFLFSVVVDEFIVNSQETERLLFQHLQLPARAIRSHLLYNGLPVPDTFIPRNPTAPWILGNASRLVPQKGLELLIEIAGVLQKKGIDFRLQIAGSGPQLESLQGLIAEKKLEEKIQLLGFVDTLDTFYAGLDVYLSTSRFEGFGFSMAEAMAHAVPVIGWDVSSIPEVVRDGENGALIPAFDVQAYAERLIAILANQDHYQQLSKGAFQYVGTHFEQSQQQKKLYELLFMA